MKSRVSAALVAGCLFSSVAPVVIAQGPPPATEVGAAQLAMANLPAKGGAKLTVTTPAFNNGADIPFENTQYRGNIFPGLSWNAGPSGTEAYVVIMQDGDALSRGAPILHWTMVNIPAKITQLQVGLAAPPTGAAFGPNICGPNQPYMGPRTPAGPRHRYHLQVFALNTTISAEANATYASLIDAMKGHVLASGEVIGLGQIAPPPPPGGN
jgi:para-nitrobenzyl esterase